MLRQKAAIRLGKISNILFKASRDVRILKHLRWPERVRYSFFRSGSEKLPDVDYPPFYPEPVLAKLNAARSLLQDSSYDKWLKKKADDIEAGVKLLTSCGKRDFFKYSADIYGLPSDTLHDQMTTPLELATKFESVINAYYSSPVKKLKHKYISSDDIRQRIEEKVNTIFGTQSPKVIIVDALSANATASSKVIKIRKNSTFTEKDVDQLFNHEALVHVATSLNGRNQNTMKILGGNYGAITKTQEGLAVFSEFITGSIDVDRMYRLSDRVLAIQMAIDGASFIDVYRFFLKRTDVKTQAFENARRVFRGGVLEGGAPFTKDIVYLDGLIRVHNFFRSAVAKGREDILELIFSGKIDLDDIPVLIQMQKEGLIKKPNYIPYWLRNMDYLVCYFAFSVFMDDINYTKVDEYYDRVF